MTRSAALESVLKTHTLGGVVQASIVDFHAEATSEKMGMGHWCDGMASLVVGTHTHVPTSDAMILGKGTAYQSDAGMCGDYDSVIGMEKLEPLRRFLTGMAKGRFEPAGGEATLSGVYVETDDKTGLATKVRMIRVGGQAAGGRLPLSGSPPTLAPSPTQGGGKRPDGSRWFLVWCWSVVSVGDRRSPWARSRPKAVPGPSG